MAEASSSVVAPAGMDPAKYEAIKAYRAVSGPAFRIKLTIAESTRAW